MSRKFKVVPVMYTSDRDAWTLTLNNAESLESLLSEGWSVVRTDVLLDSMGKASTRCRRTHASNRHCRRRSSTSSIRRRNDARHQS